MVRRRKEPAQDVWGCGKQCCVSVWDALTCGDTQVGMFCSPQTLSHVSDSNSPIWSWLMPVLQEQPEPQGRRVWPAPELQQHSHPEEAQAGKKLGPRLESGSCMQTPVRLCVSMCLCTTFMEQASSRHVCKHPRATAILCKRPCATSCVAKLAHNIHV